MNNKESFFSYRYEPDVFVSDRVAEVFVNNITYSYNKLLPIISRRASVNRTSELFSLEFIESLHDFAKNVYDFSKYIHKIESKIESKIEFIDYNKIEFRLPRLLNIQSVCRMVNDLYSLSIVNGWFNQTEDYGRESLFIAHLERNLNKILELTNEFRLVFCV